MTDDHDQITIITGSGDTHTPEIEREPSQIRMERYHIVELIGKGGMGEIYKAYDPRLNRYVALKFLWQENPVSISRFLREAQTQAKVKHENICKVYEVGEVDGRSYIAMQYIDGIPLDQRCRAMTTEEKVSVVKKAAEAVHEAHRMGLIHRDLKPSNIMIEQQKDGELKPFILDFGVARELEAPNLTTTGMVMGTPTYMAPEQARGDCDKLDRRTDVYALGVTLYELLSGKYPFPGESSVEIIMRLVSEEPPQLNKIESTVPRDLNTIVMKCLEKDPSRRYESARALADDLQRFLDDEPIKAKQAGYFYRTFRLIRKHKTLSAVIFAAVLIIFILAGVGLKIYMDSKEMAELSRRFGQKIEEFESIMRFAHMRPLHNTVEEKNIVKQRIKEIIKETEYIGSTAEGPAYYVLGRGFLSLGDLTKARAYLEKAWRNNYRDADVAHTLGLVLGQLYQGELEELEGIEEKKLYAQRQREIVKKYRLPALDFLELSQGDNLETPQYIEGLMAFYEDRYNKALKYTRNAYAESPWLYEAHRLEGDIYLKLAKYLWRRGEVQRSLTYYEQAEEAYNQSVSIARSDALGYGGLAAARAGMLSCFVETGKPPTPVMGRLEDAWDCASKADPDYTALYIPMANAHLVMGEYQMLTGTDPTGSLDGAAAFLRKAERTGGTSTEFNVSKARYHFFKGWFLLFQDESPDTEFNESRELLNEVLKKRGGLTEALMLKVKMELLLGKWEMGKGRSPSKHIKTALELLTIVDKSSPGHRGGILKTAETYLLDTAWAAWNQSDTSRSMGKCAEYLDMVLASNPDEAEAVAIKGILTFLKADGITNRAEKKRMNAEAVRLLSRAFEMNVSLRLKYNLYIMNRKTF
jgi:predicted Ser/Thr protein kinase/tetratricopeptide (TPR) repeat protein